MRFKAKILRLVIQSRFDTPEYIPEIKFSKSQIFISSPPPQQGKLFVGGETITNGNKYILNKIYNDNGKKLWQITVNGNPQSVSNIKINWINKIKCNILHRRYLIQRETDWFWKAIITAAIGFAFSLIALYLGYRQGYQTGLKEGKSMIQK